MNSIFSNQEPRPNLSFLPPFQIFVLVVFIQCESDTCLLLFFVDADHRHLDSLRLGGFLHAVWMPLDVVACRYMALRGVAQVNAAEAEFWRRSQGNRVDYSDRILGFECGGQQWVNEVSFPVGTLEEPNGKDLDYMVRRVCQGAGTRMYDDVLGRCTMAICIPSVGMLWWGIAFVSA